MEQVRQNYMPDMEEMRTQTLVSDDAYGAQILFTYMATGEGDLYLLPRDEFIQNAGNGALLPLEGDAELMAIFDEAGISLQSGWRRYTDTGETHLYGIPLSKLPGLERYAYAKDGFVSVLVTGGNDENTLTFLKILCRDMLTAEETPAEAAAVSESSETAAPEGTSETTHSAP